MKIRKAVIPVAGFGTRFLPATKAMPKEMLPIVDKPIIQYIVEEMVASGIEEIILVTGRNKRAIEDHFDRNFELEHLLEGDEKKKDLLKETKRANNLAKFVFVRQQEPKGNGHALLQAKEVVGNEPFIFAFGDDIFDAQTPVAKQLIDQYETYPSVILGGIEVPHENVSRYGIVDPEPIPGENVVVKVNRTIEKPSVEEAPSNLAVIGRYLFPPEIFEALEQTKPDKSGEIVYTGAVEILSKTMPIYAAKFQNATYYDCGNKAEYVKAVINYSLKRDDIGNEIKQFIQNTK
jgi:UTP--glucose-1-phosphate uridylyltransferase